MFKLLTVFVLALVLAYISERNTKIALAKGYHYSAWRDWAYVVLVIALTLFAGLRTNYNDTQNYITGFNSAPILSEFFSDSKNLNPFLNPLFFLYQSAIKTWFGNSQILIFISAVFTQICFIQFIKRYSDNFLFSIFLYFTLGTFVFTLAAIKQVLAMAILTLAFPSLEKKNWGRYYLLILLAMFVHTYAIAFAILPFCTVRPWKMFTFVFIAVMVVLLMNFEEAITAFMDQANELGKTIADYEIFDNATINIFRLGVYAVPPLMSLIFQKWIFIRTDTKQNVLIHMSIISFAFMSMGTQAGANMFGRMGNYFELGTICCLPTILELTFEKRSYRLITGIACICFVGFFVFANLINRRFDLEYQALGILEFILMCF